MQLKITLTPHGEDVVIALDGSLSAGDAIAAQVQLLNHVATCAGRVVLDCARLTYVASAGIRALLALHRNVSGRNQKLFLIGLSEPVRHILDVAGLLAHFTLAADVENALAQPRD